MTAKPAKLHGSLGTALSETIITLAPKVNLASKLFTWPRLFKGDCTLSGNSLFIAEDGHAEWRADVMSSDPGEDAWGSQFQLFDDHGVLLWTFGWIWSPTLNPTPSDGRASISYSFPPTCSAASHKRT